jgi:phosphoglycolate phosphatase-like HAD superfamily hydrolase
MAPTAIFSRAFGIFDLDNTILNQRILWKRNFGKFFRQAYGIAPKVSMSLFDTAGHLPLEERFRLVLMQHQQPTEKIVEDVQDFWKLVEEDRPVVYESAREVLQLCQRKGITLFGTTDLSAETMHRKLEATQLSPLFHTVCGSETGPKGSTHVTTFAYTMSCPLSTFVEKAFSVVGSLHDLSLARAQGLYSIGIANTVPIEEFLAHGADQAVRYIGILLQEEY